MKILFLSLSPPQDRSYGAAVRTNCIWRALREVGEVRTLVMIEADRIEMLPPVSDHEIARIKFVASSMPGPTRTNRKLRALISNVTSGHDFDLVVTRYSRLAWMVRPCVSADIILDADDLSKQLPRAGRSPVKRAVAAAKLAARDLVVRWLLPRLAHVWYVNPKDARRFPVASGSLLPNVVDIPSRADRAGAPDRSTLLMVGNFDYEPNAEGIRFFAEHAWPGIREAMPGARLRLVGFCPDALVKELGMLPSIEVAGFVDDLAREYALASVVVAPIFSGGGTQIKVLEALAYGCGLVVSEFALSGFHPHLRGGRHALVATQPRDWTDYCVRLMRDPREATALGEAGREIVAREYSFEVMARAVASTIRTRWPGLR